MNDYDLEESFGTLSETINELIKRGYTYDFNIKDECIVCHQVNAVLSPEDFQIDKVYRFEGDSDPDYQSILYAISSKKYNLKGTLTNAYGIYSDETFSKMIDRLQTNSSQHRMEHHHNPAAHQRSYGDPISKSPLTEIHLYTFIEQLRKDSAWNNNGHGSIAIFKSDTMRIVMIGLRPHAELKPHKANGVISVHVLEGEINFRVQEQSTLLQKGQMIALQENITHSVKAIKESFFLLTIAMIPK